jgi:hypothetical protein
LDDESLRGGIVKYPEYFYVLVSFYNGKALSYSDEFWTFSACWSLLETMAITLCSALTGSNY